MRDARATLYAVLWHHDIAEPHYDLMFETTPGSQLATWRVKDWPIERPTEASRLRDHRRFYMEYEGDLSDSRGRVQRMARGSCEVRGVEDDAFEVRLLEGVSTMALRLSQLDAERWMISPM